MILTRGLFVIYHDLTLSSSGGITLRGLREDHFVYLRRSHRGWLLVPSPGASRTLMTI